VGFLLDGGLVKRLPQAWNVRIGLGVIVLAMTLLGRSSEVSLLNHLLSGLGVWMLLVVAYEARALARADFWYEFTVSRTKLSLFRIVFFSLIAFDAWRQTEHMARYGTNGFNVSHFAWLDSVLPVPTASGILIVYLLQAYLAARIVLGAAVPVSIRLLTVLYGYSYFISQVDSYQHHYFVFLLLVISCFVPWQRLSAEDVDTDADESEDSPSNDKAPKLGKLASKYSKKSSAAKKLKKGQGKRKPAAKKQPAAKGEATNPAEAELVKTWAVRLLLVQMAVLYGWAAITKLDPQWLSGAAMAPGLQGPDVAWLNYYARNLPGELYATSAQLTMVAEALLLLTVVNRKWWFVSIPVGVGLHVGIELANFEIGIFSYYMIGMYLLLVPERVFQLWAEVFGAFTERLRSTWLGIGDRLAGLGAGTWAVIGVCIVAGSASLWQLPFEEVFFVATAMSVIAVSPIAFDRKNMRGMVWSGVAHALACLMLVGFFVSTDTTHDMYKKLAGSHRRLGNQDKMYAAYAKLTKVSPDFGRSYHHMGHVHRRRSEEWAAQASKETIKGELEAAKKSKARAKSELTAALEKYAAAMAAYKRTHDKDPQDYWAYLWEAILWEESAGRLMRRGKKKAATSELLKAIDAGRKALQLNPKKSNVIRNARRIIRSARANIKRLRPKPKTKPRKRRAPPGKSVPDP